LAQHLFCWVDASLKRWSVGEYADIPGQFWLMFVGMMLATIGTTMIWPFLMIYASETLSLPLVAVTSLMTINAATGLVSSILAGPGHRPVGPQRRDGCRLDGQRFVLFFLSRADTYAAFALILGGSGIFSPLYTCGHGCHAGRPVPDG
jgi:hypothetical protein